MEEVKDELVVAATKVSVVAAERFPRREFSDMPTVVEYVSA